MKIQLKRSNVLAGGVAKQPTAEQMEYGELAVNYNETDPVIFIKDSTDAIIRLAGAGASGNFDGDYESLTNKPTIGDGALTVKDSDGTEVAKFTANQTGSTELNLPEGFSGDYNDLTNQPTIGDGTITIKSGGTDIGTFTVNQTGSTDIDIPAGLSNPLIEKVIVRNTKPYIIDIENANVYYHDTAHSGNIQLNFRYNNFLGLNTELSIGETVAITVLVTTNAFDYYVTLVQIDGVAQTVKWIGAEAPTESAGAGVDAYSFQVIKTAADTYTVFGSVNNFG